MPIRSALVSFAALAVFTGAAPAHEIIVDNGSPYSILTVTAFSEAEGYAEELLGSDVIEPGGERRLHINNVDGDCSFVIQAQFETRNGQNIGPADLCLGLSKFIFE